MQNCHLMVKRELSEILKLSYTNPALQLEQQVPGFPGSIGSQKRAQRNPTVTADGNLKLQMLEKCFGFV